MSTTVDHASLAGDLARAQRDRCPIEPLTDAAPGLTVEDAYAIQLAGVAARQAEGAVVRGHKVGLSSVAMQQQVGVHEPDYGHLLHDMFAFEDEVLEPARFLQPRVEVELAFVLGRDLSGPCATTADAVRAIDYVLPALEIVDSRIAGWRVRIQDTVADNASSGALVLGGRPLRLTDLDPRSIAATLVINGQLRQTGSTAAVLGNPVTALAWLANKVSAFGVVLREGDVVLPGSCTRMEPIHRGDVIRADFARLGHVAISIRAEA